MAKIQGFFTLKQMFLKVLKRSLEKECHLGGRGLSFKKGIS